jgi:hypothetical protein
MSSGLVLLVDPHADMIVGSIRQALKGVAHVEPCAEFHGAKTRLLTSPPDVLLSNLRLHSYNGLHLVLLASKASTRCLVYADPDDLVLAREAQRLGAFYERASRLPFVLPAFFNGELPDGDRRDVTRLDRRLRFRGSRRRADLRDALGVLKT